MGGATEHEGRDGRAYASWDEEGEGRSPGRRPAARRGGPNARLRDRQRHEVARPRRARGVPAPQHGGRWPPTAAASSSAAVSSKTLEGDWPGVRIVVIEFPDAGAARAWWDSEAYAPLKKLRRGASDTDIVLVEGGDQP